MLNVIALLQSKFMKKTATTMKQLCKPLGPSAERLSVGYLEGSWKGKELEQTHARVRLPCTSSMAPV